MSSNVTTKLSYTVVKREINEPFFNGYTMASIKTPILHPKILQSDLHCNQMQLSTLYKRKLLKIFSNEKQTFCMRSTACIVRTRGRPRQNRCLHPVKFKNHKSNM